MDFTIPEELKMVQATVKDFVKDELLPLERDILGRKADLSDARMYLPPEIEERLVETVKAMGLWGLSVPEELGGAGLGTLGNCLVEEELSQTIVPFDFGDVTPILFECDERQKESYLLPLLERKKQAYLGLMEPGREGDLAAMEMRAEKVNGRYILDGRKISFSKAGEDYFAAVFAATDPGKGVREGVTCFLVDRDTSGFTTVGGEEKTGWRAWAREPILLAFDRCEVSAEDVLGEDGKAFHLGGKWLPSRRIVRCASSVGAARRLLTSSIEQIGLWQSFGQSISVWPSVQAALADIAICVHATRLMVYHAACKADEGEEISREAAMVKIFAADMIRRASDDAAHIRQGPGGAAAPPVDELRRAATASGATNKALELQRLIITRDLLKNYVA